MQLTPITERFVLHWGEMGTRWGVNRTVAQIHALLFVTGTPMTAEEIATTLNVARSNVSNSLRELANWNLIRSARSMGDRREVYETSGDVWELMRIIVRERKLREFDPTVDLLRSLTTDPSFGSEPATQQKRINDTLGLMDSLSGWTNEMLKLDHSILGKLVRLGARIQTLLTLGKKTPKNTDSTGS